MVRPEVKTPFQHYTEIRDMVASLTKEYGSAHIKFLPDGSVHALHRGRQWYDYGVIGGEGVQYLTDNSAMFVLLNSPPTFAKGVKS